MSKRFVATTDTTLGEVLASIGGVGAEAIPDGRVFVGRYRAKSEKDAVPSGTEVVVHAAREATALPDPFVLHHGDGVVAVDKPAGVPTIADTVGAAGSLLDLAGRATGERNLHPTSRLDREVSGVVVFAVTKDAREAIARARTEEKYERRYVALARGHLPTEARWIWPIGRARDPRLRRAVLERDAKGAAAGEVAATRMRVVSRSTLRDAAYALLAVAPETGRTHQIRVHAAAAGAPLLGDRAYGGEIRLALASGRTRALGRIALHCARVEIDLGHCIITVRSPVPRELVTLSDELALGSRERIEEALTCIV